MRSENTYNVVACVRFGEMADLWLRSSIDAHGFILREYWEANREAMSRSYLPAAENYACVEVDRILGFVSLNANHIEALFVDTLAQGMGIGTALLSHAKSLRTKLTLAVYKDNIRAVGFYSAHGFEVFGERTDEATGCGELLMEWSRERVPTIL